MPGTSSTHSSPDQYHFSREGFQPLDKSRSNQNFKDNTMSIPLQKVVSHGSTGARRQADAMPSTVDSSTTAYDEKTKSSLFHRRGHAGRRKAKTAEGAGEALGNGFKDEDDTEILTKMGRIYTKILNFSIVTRYFLYVSPVAILIAIPIILGATALPTARIGVAGDKAHPDTKPFGVPMVWFFTWIEIVWLSLWVSKIVARFLPAIFEFILGVVSAGTRKYAQAIRALETPLSLVGWAVTSLATFKPLTKLPPVRDALSQPLEDAVQHWEDVLQHVLFAAFIATLVFLAEKVLIQVISINYHRTQFDRRIKESKRHIHLLGLLYDASRSLFPAYCPEFEEEDHIINDSPDFGLGSKTATGRPGSAAPLKLFRNIGRIGDKVTAAFGNVAQEITGKEVFKPDSAHAIVLEALEKTNSSEALARRLWMSFVVEGRDTLLREDIVEVLGENRLEEAEECFNEMDKDGNGDISLDEMIMMVTQWGRDRKSITTSMHDVDNAIGALDHLLCIVVFLIIIFIFVGFLNTNFASTLATAGTALISLSFVFAATVQEVLGSCVFLFAKHPYDVGDRVDLNLTEQLTVENIALLYTVFKRTSNGKTVQIPNLVLNSLWVENVSRSKAMYESISLFVNFGTTFEDIQLLRREMELFVRDKENSRDFFPNVDVDVVSVAELDKLELSVSLRHKSNWANGTLKCARRNKFFCALVMALRKVPIYGPGGSDAALGDKDRPTYSVAVTETEAQKARDSHSAAVEAARMVPSDKKDSTKIDGQNGEHSGVDYLSVGDAEARAVGNLTNRSPALDIGRDDAGESPAPRRSTVSSTKTDGRPSMESSAHQSLHREPSRGKRRAVSGDYPEPVPAIVETSASNEAPSPVYDQNYPPRLQSTRYQAPPRSNQQPSAFQSYSQQQQERQYPQQQGAGVGQQYNRQYNGPAPPYQQSEESFQPQMPPMGTYPSNQSAGYFPSRTPQRGTPSRGAADGPPPHPPPSHPPPK